MDVSEFSRHALGRALAIVNEDFRQQRVTGFQWWTIGHLERKAIRNVPTENSSVRARDEGFQNARLLPVGKASKRLVEMAPPTSRMPGNG